LVINNSWNDAASRIVAVIVGGGAALYKFDDGRGDRTSSTIAARIASD
jgi:hypothetical protein